MCDEGPESCPLLATYSFPRLFGRLSDRDNEGVEDAYGEDRRGEGWFEIGHGEVSREDFRDRRTWAVAGGRGIGQSINGTEAPEMDDSA